MPLYMDVHNLGEPVTVDDVAKAYLADLQQDLLVPFVGSHGPDADTSLQALAVDATLAGRAYQHVQVLTQELPDGRVRLWLPLLDGSDRLGVMSAVATNNVAAAAPELLERLQQFAAITAELIMTKTMYGDAIVRVRRSRADLWPACSAGGMGSRLGRVCFSRASLCCTCFSRASPRRAGGFRACRFHSCSGHAGSCHACAPAHGCLSRIPAFRAGLCRLYRVCP